jgi:hypothetical protein
MPFFRRLSGLVYHVYPMIDGTVYDISVSIGPSVRQASIILLVFLILQFLYLILRAFRDAGMIRRTLDPITELQERHRRSNLSPNSWIRIKWRPWPEARGDQCGKARHKDFR